ncbi:MAG: 4-hydroxy-tetrahydrodipicolinate reductase [Firmicutes bacterium]|nr:4-hydroxy-tetrahydrodipicolinate reductase [Bacillota bacterium]
MTIKVAVNGALGNMGQTVIRAVFGDPELQLVAAIDIKGDGSDIGTHVGLGELNIPVENDLAAVLARSQPDVLVDFTTPFAVMQNIETALSLKVRPVVGTTGITETDLETIRRWSKQYNTGALIAPNFAIGAVLMMLFAARAAKYLPHVEIIELHHDQKIDAPSGTAMKTAEMILKSRGQVSKPDVEELEKLPGARGGNLENIHIHSVRLPGLVAHQEVIFGGIGQTLTIRHDSIDRTSFMPGVLLAIKEIMQHEDVIYGLENILNL